jgi:hypothetical protein
LFANSAAAAAGGPGDAALFAGTAELTSNAAWHLHRRGRTRERQIVAGCHQIITRMHHANPAA